jgi:hypothetical protein
MKTKNEIIPTIGGLSVMLGAICLFASAFLALWGFNPIAIKVALSGCLLSALVVFFCSVFEES